MNVATQTRISSVQAPCAFTWPVPPFFRNAATPAAERTRTCSVELLNGNEVEGELLVADWAGASIDVRTSDERSRRFDFDQIRTLRLMLPVTLTRDANVVTGVGVDATHVADATTFSIRFHDGHILAGTTRGFVREKVGLFLYLLEGETSGALRCFIPARHLADGRRTGNQGPRSLNTAQLPIKSALIHLAENISAGRAVYCVQACRGAAAPCSYRVVCARVVLRR